MWSNWRRDNDARRKKLSILAKYQKFFEGGEKGALLEAMYFCFREGAPLPIWAKDAFEAAYDRATDGEIGSWDAVFGKPWGKGRRKARWMESRGREIWMAVRTLRRRDGDEIEDAFAKVAATKHMTVPTVRRLYYECVRRFEKFASQMRSDFEKP
jgi:hypothetical protein